VYVEFLTKDDYFPLGGVSTDDQHQALGAVNAGWISNHVDLGRRLSEQVRRQADGIVFGVFYDPVVRDRRENEPRRQAQELLRLQVRDFIDWLKAQGAI